MALDAEIKHVPTPKEIVEVCDRLTHEYYHAPVGHYHPPEWMWDYLLQTLESMQVLGQLVLQERVKQLGKSPDTDSLRDVLTAVRAAQSQHLFLALRAYAEFEQLGWDTALRPCMMDGLEH